MSQTYKGHLLKGLFLNGNMRLDESVIKKIIEDQPQVPVRINFSGEPIGRTDGFTMNEDTIDVTFTLRYPDMEKLKLHVLPNFAVLSDQVIADQNDTSTIKDATLVEVSLSSIPYDVSLKPIE